MAVFKRSPLLESCPEMAEGTKREAIKATQETLEANARLQEDLVKYIRDLEGEHEQLDKLINSLSKLESSLPDEPSDGETSAETIAYGHYLEGLRHTLTAKQLGSETSPFHKAVQQRQWYEQMTTTRPFTREEQRLLHTSVVVENKRLHALRARERGENPFTAVEQLPDEHFDTNDSEINWNSVAQNMSSVPPRSADQCRVMYVSTELPSINRSDWPLEELEKLKKIVEAHNRTSRDAVEDVERDREKLRVDWVEVARELGTKRTALQCLKKFVFEPSPFGATTVTGQREESAPGPPKSRARDKTTGHAWSEEEDRYLLEGIQRHGMGNWPEVALHLNTAMAGKSGHMARTPNQCSFRYGKSLCPTIKKGKWTKEEDEALRKGVAAFGRTWTKVQEYVQGRTDAQCRERWSNMLDPSLKTGPWDEEEDKILLDAASRKLPWSKISALLPGRTDSRCSKRYQMLIKQREQEQQQEDNPPSVEESQKRSKKRKAIQKSQSQEESPHGTLVTNIDGVPTPSTDALLAGDTIAHDPPPKPKARLKPRPKLRLPDGNGVQDKPVQGSHGIDVDDISQTLEAIEPNPQAELEPRDTRFTPVRGRGEQSQPQRKDAGRIDGGSGDVATSIIRGTHTSTKRRSARTSKK